MQLKIARLSPADAPQIGMLLIDGIPRMITLELPEKFNATQVSCIPEGTYVCKRVHNRNTSGGMFIATTFEVTNVPGRAGILFHVGNTSKDTHGCILLGTRIAPSGFAILQSREAFGLFLKATEEANNFTLVIENVRQTK